MAETCKTCRFWSGEEEEYRQVKELRLCKRAIKLWDATEWTKDEDGDDSCVERTVKPEYAVHKMFVQDGSDYIARLYTKPDFGCTEHQPSPTTDRSDSDG